MITFRKITEDNLDDIVKLTVSEEQRSFVASNTDSILEAYVAITSDQVALPFGLYHGDELVGFIMFGYGTSGDPREPRLAPESYCLWRLMIDKKFQGKGYGKEAMQAALDYLRTFPAGAATHCWLSYEPENERARTMYLSCGFEETGETCCGEIVAAIKL